MKSYVGQRGRDRVLRVWIDNHGQRSPLAGDDVAGRILSDIFGARLIEQDYRCYQDFRDEVIAPRLSEATWTLTEGEVRKWRDAYLQQPGRPRQKSSATGDGHDRAGQSTDEHDLQAVVSWGNGITRAMLLYGTPNVLLLEGERPAGTPLPPGSPVRVGLPGTARMLPGRLAAYGQNGRFLVALGSRAVRGAARMRTELRAVLHLGGVPRGLPATIIDLSSSGARVRGHALPVGSDFELTFVPPGRHESVRLRCVVVRPIDDALPAEVGVAFCGAALSFRVELTSRSPA